MLTCDTVIRNATVLDGNGAASEPLDVAIHGDRISAVGIGLRVNASICVDADGLALAPGFIDAHTHDDTSVIRKPEMLASSRRASPLSSSVIAVLAQRPCVCTASHPIR